MSAEAKQKAADKRFKAFIRSLLKGKAKPKKA